MDGWIRKLFMYSMLVSSLAHLFRFRSRWGGFEEIPMFSSFQFLEAPVANGNLRRDGEKLQ